jgi:hypothetical protein
MMCQGTLRLQRLSSFLLRPPSVAAGQIQLWAGQMHHVPHFRFRKSGMQPHFWKSWGSKSGMVHPVKSCPPDEHLRDAAVIVEGLGSPSLLQDVSGGPVSEVPHCADVELPVSSQLWVVMRHDVDGFSSSSWEPREEGMMSTAASFSHRKKPRFNRIQEKAKRLKVMPASFATAPDNL